MSTAAAQEYTSGMVPNYSGQLTYPAAYTYPANLTSTLYGPSVASYNQTYNNAALAANSMTAAYNFSMGINQVCNAYFLLKYKSL